MGRIKWGLLTAACDALQDQGFLTSPLPKPLPTCGPLHELLQPIRKVALSCTPFTLVEEDLRDALKAGAVGRLTVLIDCFQQQPCLELHSACPQDLTKLDWYLLMEALNGLIQLAYCKRNASGGIHNDLLDALKGEFQPLLGKACLLVLWMRMPLNV